MNSVSTCTHALDGGAGEYFIMKYSSLKNRYTVMFKITVFVFYSNSARQRGAGSGGERQVRGDSLQSVV